MFHPVPGSRLSFVIVMKPDAEVADLHRYLVFTLEDLRLALSLSAVETVTHIVHVTPLPNAPRIVAGVVNLRGRVIPVVNIRRRFNLGEREVMLSDRLVFAHTARRPVALAVDELIGVVESTPDCLVSGESVLPVPHVEGVMKFNDGLIFIHDLDKFLDLEEEEALDSALASI